MTYNRVEDDDDDNYNMMTTSGMMRITVRVKTHI